MKIVVEKELWDFGAWDGGQRTLDVLDSDDCDALESYFAEEYEDGITDTELNDFLWFERDTIATICGFSDWEELEIIRTEDYDAIIDKITDRNCDITEDEVENMARQIVFDFGTGDCLDDMVDKAVSEWEANHDEN